MSLLSPLYITYYTVNTPYEQLVLPFQENLKSIGLDCKVVPVKTKGNWQKNTQLKPRVLLEEISFTDRPLCFLDLDVKFLQKPLLLEHIETDFAVCMYANKIENGVSFTLSPEEIFQKIKDHPEALELLTDWIRKGEYTPNFLEKGYGSWVLKALSHFFPTVASGVHFEMKSIVVYFKNNAASLLLLQEWLKETEKNPEMWDQHALAKAYMKLNNFVTLTPLPCQYCLLSEMVPYYKNAVILHDDISRKFRSFVDEGE